MDIPISLDLHNFPEHSRLIADMLLGYADLESFVLDIVGQALNGNADDAVPVLYCLRGAEDRLNVADGLLKPFMQRLGLEGPYSQWLGAMRRCKTIRNQYAHCAWDSEHGQLYFCNLYDAAEAGELSFKLLKLELLQEQHRYFQFASSLIMYLMAEARFLQDGNRKHDRTIPKSLPKPNLHSAED